MRYPYDELDQNETLELKLDRDYILTHGNCHFEFGCKNEIFSYIDYAAQDFMDQTREGMYELEDMPANIYMTFCTASDKTINVASLEMIVNYKDFYGNYYGGENDENIFIESHMECMDLILSYGDNDWLIDYIKNNLPVDLWEQSLWN